MTPVRLLGTAQLGLGLLLTLRPDQVATFAAGPYGRAAPGWLVRVLGVRSALQGAVTLAKPTGEVLIGGALVDAAHASSMVAFVLASRRYRRAAAISALAAAASAAVAALAVPRDPERPR